MNKDKDDKKFENWIRSNVPEHEINQFHKENLRRELLSSFDKKASHNFIFNFIKMKNFKMKITSFVSVVSLSVVAIFVASQLDWKNSDDGANKHNIVSAKEILERSQQTYEKVYSDDGIHYTKTKYETFNNKSQKSVLENSYSEEIWRDDLGQVKRHVYSKESGIDYKEMVIFSEGRFVEYSEGYLVGISSFDNLINELLINVGCENLPKCDLIYSKNASDLAKLVNKMVDQKDKFDLANGRYLDEFPNSFSLEFKKSEDLLGKGNKSYFYFDKNSYQLLAIQIIDSNYLRDMRATFLDSSYISDNEVFSTQDFSQDAEPIQEIDPNEWGEVFFSEYYSPEYPYANFKGIGRIVTNTSTTGNINYSDLFPYAFESNSHFLLIMNATPEYDQAMKLVDTGRLVVITAKVEDEINYERPTAIEQIYEIKEIDISSVISDDEIQNIEDIPTIDPEIIFSYAHTDPSDRLVSLTKINNFSFITYSGGEINCYDVNEDYLCEVNYKWSPDGVSTKTEKVTLYFPNKNTIDEFILDNNLEGVTSDDLAIVNMYDFCGENAESYPESYNERSEQYFKEREMGGNILNRGYVTCTIQGEKMYEFGVYETQDENYPYSLLVSEYREDAVFSHAQLIEGSINFPQPVFEEAVSSE